MNIPIAFSFNNNFTLPAGVCITSLLENAGEDTFYSINILYSAHRLNHENIKKIQSLVEKYQNCKIQFIDVKDAFQDSFENRNISIDTYFRLLIPTLFPQIKRMIYSDVDVVFNGDLSSFYNTNMEDKALGAVVTLQKKRSIKGYVECDAGTYFNAGFLLMDLEKIRLMKNYEEDFHRLAAKVFEFHDQDILNILFRNNVKFFDIKYNFSRAFSGLTLSKGLLESCKNPIMIHYTGRKPWDGFVSIKSEVWWFYFCKSIFFSEEIYKNYLIGYGDLEEVWMINKIAKKIGLIWMYKLARKVLKKAKKE